MQNHAIFTLDPRLESDTIFIGDLTLCRILLMNNANYPWVVLVPKINNVQEIYQLTQTDQQLLMKEIELISKQLATLFAADKINVAALGNVVSQLHIHIIVRYKTDIAWPQPVWGIAKPTPYANDAQENIIKKLVTAIQKEIKHHA